MKKLLRFEWVLAALTGLFCVGCLFLFLSARPSRSGLQVSVSTNAPSAQESRDPAPGMLEGERLDLNRADADELTRLPGIGEKRAADIVAWRSAHGPFERVEELLEVPGIGEGTLNDVRSYVTVE